MAKLLSEEVPNMPVILIVGPAGSGKTTFLTRMRWPGKKTYILDIDKNLAGPRKVARLQGYDISHVEYDHIDVDDNGVPVPIRQQFRRLGVLLDRAILDPTIGIIGITSTTTLAPRIMDETCIQLGKPEGVEVEKFEWRKYSNMWQYFIAKLRTAGKMIVMDGHLQTDRGEIDKVLKMALALEGKVGDLVPMQVTDYWLAGVDQEVQGGKTIDKYMLQTVQTNVYPNMKASLDLPRRFEATQAMADQVIKQVTH